MEKNKKGCIRLIKAADNGVSHNSFRNRGRVGKGFSAQASHGTVREALTSYGSYYPVAMTLPIVLIPPILPVD